MSIFLFVGILKDMGKKRANQPGYIQAKGKDGRTIWVPEQKHDVTQTVKKPKTKPSVCVSYLPETGFCGRKATKKDLCGICARRKETPETYNKDKANDLILKNWDNIHERTLLNMRIFKGDKDELIFEETTGDDGLFYWFGEFTYHLEEVDTDKLADQIMYGLNTWMPVNFDKKENLFQHLVDVGANEPENWASPILEDSDLWGTEFKEPFRFLGDLDQGRIIEIIHE